MPAIFSKNCILSGELDSYCLTCGVYLTSEEDSLFHIQDLKHKNLNKSLGYFDKYEKDFIRKIDDIYQCLICNNVIHEQSLTKHLNSEEHNKIFETYNKNQNDKSNSNEKDGTIANTMQKINNDIQPQTIDRNATKSKDIKENEGKISSESLSRTVETSKKQNENIKQHVKEKPIDNKNKRTVTKIKMNKFTWMLQTCETIANKYIIINDSIFVHFYSFVGLNSFRNRIICQFCDIDLIPENVSAHIKTTTHNDLFINCSVITSLKNEFIRQIKSDKYHCGHCANIESDFDDMIDHIATPEHKRIKVELQSKIFDFKFQISQGLLRVNLNHLPDLSAIRNSNLFREVPM